MGTWLVLDKYGRQKTSASTIPAPIEFVGDGGIAIGGGALIRYPILTVGNGGLELDGPALIRYPILTVGNGGLEIDGAAILQYPVLTVGNGGLELDGAAEYFQPFRVVGNGGLEIDGAAQTTDPVHWWRFGENTGTTAADTGTGPAITISSIDGWTTTSLPSQPPGNVSAARLSGTGAQMDFSADILPDVTADFTVMGRSRINASSLDFTSVFPIGPGAAGAMVSIEAAETFYLSGGFFGNFVPGNLAPPVNAFFHWCLRRRASDNFVEVLLDGVSSNQLLASGDPLAASGYLATQTSSNSISVDHIDFRVYNRYVEDAELAAIIGGPNVLLSDEFTDTTGVLLSAHTMDIGPGWTYTTGTGAYGDGDWQIQSNAAKQVNTNPNPSGLSIALADAGLADGEGFVEFTTTGSHDNAVGMAFRGTNAGNNYLVVVDCTAGTIVLYKVVANAFTAIGSSTTGLSFANSTTYAISVTASGNSLAATVTGPGLSGSASATDSTYPTQTKWGIWVAAPNAGYTLCSFDNFQVTS